MSLGSDNFRICLCTHCQLTEAMKIRNVPDSDIALWLCNKLGISNEEWKSELEQSRVPTSGFRSSALTTNINNRPSLGRANAGRKEGGVKRLHPLGYGAPKKRWKLQYIEDAKKASENATSLQSPTSSNTGTTPDYAAGLTATPSYAPASPAPIAEPAAATPSPAATATISSPPQASPSTPAPNASPTIVTQQVQQLPQKSKIFAPTQPQIQTTPVITQVPASDVQPVQQPTVAHIRNQPQPAATVWQGRGLAFTREQMLEAQDMFRTANKVTRPEKCLILRFMAGSRENLCPHLGDIVTIKLSEDQEKVLQPDDTYLKMLVETHFEMNYNNGEWKRIKKYRYMQNIVGSNTSECSGGDFSFDNKSTSDQIVPTNVQTATSVFTTSDQIVPSE